MTTVAVLLPTKGRAAQLHSRLADLLEQETPEGVTLMVIAGMVEGDDDTDIVLTELTEQFDNLYVINRPVDSFPADGHYQAYQAAKQMGADWFVLGADDIIWHQGWLAEALKVAQDTGAQVIGLNDGHTDLDDFAPHYMANWKFCEEQLGDRLVPEGYVTWWWDRHVCQLARMHETYAPAWSAWAEHRHPDWRTAVMDDTYREMEDKRGADMALYMAWRDTVKV